MTDHVGRQIDEGRRWLVVGIIAAVPVVFWTQATDVFQLSKATLLVLGVVGLLGLGGVRIATTGELAVPRGTAAMAAAAFAAAAVITTVASQQVMVSTLGTYGRYAGAITYLSLVALLAVILATFEAGHVERLVRAALVGIGLAATYGLVQMLGADPVDFSGTDHSGDVVASMGNANLVAAAMAIGTPLAVMEAVRAQRNVRRAVNGGLALLFLVVMAGAGSAQGPAALAAGVGVLALALVLRLRTDRRRFWVTAWAGAAVLAATTVAAGLFERGPLAFVGRESTLTTRRYDWEAAVSMFTAEPVTGVGLGRFGTGNRTHRSVEAAVDRPLNRLADTAHDVPLTLFAEGGLLLGLTYLAFVLAVAVTLVVGLRRAEGERLLLLGGVGGAWAAYQVQSLVSFDAPSLAVLHWTMAGGILVLAGPPTVDILRLPWAGPTGKAAKTRANRERVQKRQRISLGIAGALFLVAAVFITRPLRADMAAFDAAGSDSVDAALDRIGTANELAPWESTYWFIAGRIHLQAGDEEAAQVAFAEALEREPTALSTIQTSARLATRRDDVQLARSLYGDALAVEPHAPALKAEIGEFELLHGSPSRAVELLEEAVELDASRAVWWALLGSAHEAAGDEPEARRAYERALDLDRSLERAQEGLAGLG